MFSEPPIILCIDDDQDDRHFVYEAIKKAEPSFSFVEASNGYEGLRFLQEANENGRLPNLIILDINMPKLNGKQIVVEIKNDQRLSNIPLVIFSTASNPTDVLYFAHYGVQMFTKPSNIENFTNTVTQMLGYCKKMAV